MSRQPYKSLQFMKSASKQLIPNLIRSKVVLWSDVAVQIVEQRFQKNRAHREKIKPITSKEFSSIEEEMEAMNLHKLGRYQQMALTSRKRPVLTYQSQQEAFNHPDTNLIDNYCLYPEKLSTTELEQVEKHLSECGRCKRQVDDTKSKSRYLRDILERGYQE
ncbi:hypothetical protein [Kordiimonas pumila]|uniref:Zinc-finger domain-containing protein n=1 Tax=Kordiimonas pumila TaxID=2161677 RepID=A0ABV7D7Y0_9PROT|nr:hypothetical protein [Kordiimonas pumila]